MTKILCQGLKTLSTRQCSQHDKKMIGEDRALHVCAGKKQREPLHHQDVTHRPMERSIKHLKTSHEDTSSTLRLVWALVAEIFWKLIASIFDHSKAQGARHQCLCYQYPCRAFWKTSKAHSSRLEANRDACLKARKWAWLQLAVSSPTRCLLATYHRCSHSTTK